MKSQRVAYTESCGNVFADLGLPNPDERLLKAELVFEIRKFIEDKGWTQQEAAARAGVDQAEISTLLGGKLQGFPADRLLSILNRIGCRVEHRA